MNLNSQREPIRADEQQLDTCSTGLLTCHEAQATFSVGDWSHGSFLGLACLCADCLAYQRYLSSFCLKLLVLKHVMVEYSKCLVIMQFLCCFLAVTSLSHVPSNSRNIWLNATALSIGSCLPAGGTNERSNVLLRRMRGKNVSDVSWACSWH